MFNKHDKQMYAMDKALHELNLDAHIYQVPYKKDLSTYADKLIGIQFERLIPIHRSFMYCNSLDMDFFFSKITLRCIHILDVALQKKKEKN